MKVFRILVVCSGILGSIPGFAAPVRGTVELTQAVKADFDLDGRGVAFVPAPGLRCRWAKKQGAKPVYEYFEKTSSGKRLFVPGGTRLHVTEVHQDRAAGTVELTFRSNESILTQLKCEGGLDSLDQVFGFRMRESGDREVAASH